MPGFSGFLIKVSPEEKIFGRLGEFSLQLTAHLCLKIHVVLFIKSDLGQEYLLQWESLKKNVFISAELCEYVVV